MDLKGQCWINNNRNTRKLPVNFIKTSFAKTKIVYKCSFVLLAILKRTRNK